MSEVISHKQGWRLTQEAFDRFLLRLDSDRERAGAQYERIRGKLITFFQCRDCPAPEDHADETINRVIRRLEVEDLRDPATYVYGVARMLLLELAREGNRASRAVTELSRTQATIAAPEAADLRVECFKTCLQKLAPENRALITEYYEGERSARIARRNRLAERLGLSATALRIRACRIRNSLETCVARCLQQKQKG